MYVNAVRTLTKSSRHMPVTLLVTVHFEPFLFSAINWSKIRSTPLGSGVCFASWIVN